MPSLLGAHDAQEMKGLEVPRVERKDGLIAPLGFGELAAGVIIGRLPEGEGWKEGPGPGHRRRSAPLSSRGRAGSPPRP